VVEKAELHQELKSAVRELCRSFPDVYWRELDAKRGYPEEFVQALTKAGYMATLIPEEYGGAGLGVGEAAAILEMVHHSGAFRRLAELVIHNISAVGVQVDTDGLAPLRIQAS